MKKTWSDSVRVQALAFWLYCGGASVDEIAALANVNRRTVFKWMTAYDWKGLRDHHWEQFQLLTDQRGQLVAAYSAIVPNAFFSKGTGHA